MTRGLTWRTGGLARLRRRLGLDRNPLRRRADRVETSIMAGLIAAFLLGAPYAAVTAEHWSQTAGLRAMRAQAGWRQVPAVLLANAPRYAGFIYQPPSTDWVRASWTAPAGHVHVAVVPAPGGSRAGAAVPIWVDAAGYATSAPLTRAQVTGRSVTAAVVTPIMLAVAVLGLAAITRLLFQRFRLAGWAAAWRSIEPQWHRRRR
jgi:hypothetical protein